MMKYNPTINCSKSGSAITRIPKMIAIMARTGFDMVTPIALRPFSIVSPIMVSSLANSTAKTNMAYARKTLVVYFNQLADLEIIPVM